MQYYSPKQLNLNSKNINMVMNFESLLLKSLCKAKQKKWRFGETYFALLRNYYARHSHNLNDKFTNNETGKTPYYNEGLCPRTINR